MTASSAGAWSFAYAATGQLTAAVQGNGNTVTRTFDPHSSSGLRMRVFQW